MADSPATAPAAETEQSLLQPRQNGIVDRLHLRGIDKVYGSIRANIGVDLSIKAGSVHALLGENGAGKSTLVKIICGVTQPDGGTISIDGVPLRMTDPKIARRAGIGVVFQHFSLFEGLTVVENLALGLDHAVAPRYLVKNISDLLAHYDLSLPLHRQVATLSVSERQRLEITRALLLQPRLLVMDEPTSVLTPQESQHLFTILRNLATEGCSILYISHKLGEIRDLCDAATIMRGGRVIGACDPRATSTHKMATMMFGTRLGKSKGKGVDRHRRDVCLVVQGLTIAARNRDDVALENIDFTLHAGEILGIAGIAGNGQRELAAALDGQTRSPEGCMIRFKGEQMAHRGVRDRRAVGFGAIPEDRNSQGAVGSFSLSENAYLTAWSRRDMTRGGVIAVAAAIGFARRVIRSFLRHGQSHRTPIQTLSGGNMQKFIAGREILQSPAVLVASQPSAGLDAGAVASIHEALRDLAGEGSGIILISQDLDELMALSDRIAVLNRGHLSVPRPVGDLSIEEIGLLMSGRQFSSNAGLSEDIRVH